MKGKDFKSKISYLRKKKVNNCRASYLLDYILGEKETYYRNMAQKIKTCSDKIFWYQPEDGSETRMVKNRCKNRLCEICQDARRYKISRNVSEFMQDKFEISQDQLHYLTITIKNTKDLEEGLRQINLGWRKLKRRIDFPYSGFIKTVEINLDKDGKFHPHLHVLLVRSKNKDKCTWRFKEEWLPKTRESFEIDYDPVLHIKNIKLTETNIKDEVEKLTYYSTKTIPSLLEEHIDKIIEREQKGQMNLVDEVNKIVDKAVQNDALSLRENVKEIPKEEMEDIMVGYLKATHNKKAISAGGDFFKGIKLSATKKSDKIKFGDITLTPDNHIPLEWGTDLEDYVVVDEARRKKKDQEKIKSYLLDKRDTRLQDSS